MCNEKDSRMLNGFSISEREKEKRRQDAVDDDDDDSHLIS